jgi:hypothetical protein
LASAGLSEHAKQNHYFTSVRKADKIDGQKEKKGKSTAFEGFPLAERSMVRIEESLVKRLIGCESRLWRTVLDLIPSKRKRKKIG